MWQREQHHNEVGTLAADMVEYYTNRRRGADKSSDHDFEGAKAEIIDTSLGGA